MERRAQNKDSADILSKEDLQSKLLEMKKMIEQQQQLQRQLQANLEQRVVQEQQPLDDSINQILDNKPQATQQRKYPSYEVVENPTSPEAQRQHNFMASANAIPSNIHQSMQFEPKRENLLTSSQFVRFQEQNEDADVESSQIQNNYRTPSKNVQQERGRSRTKENTGGTHHSPYCANEENLKFKISEYQRREKELEKTIQRLQAKLAIQEEQSLDIREQSAEKQKRSKYEHQAFLQEIKELKQQIAYKQGEIETKDRENVTLKKELSTYQSENQKLLERNDQLNTILKNKQNDQVNQQRQIEDFKHAINSQKTQIRELQQSLEIEKKQKQQEISKIEEDNKKKFSQLKYLVDQYRSQMHEYQRITQVNQDMMAKLVGEKKVVQAQIYPPTMTQGSQNIPGIMKVERQPGRKHYRDNKNHKDTMSGIFSAEQVEENEEKHQTPNRKRALSEYQSTICLSAEKKRQMAQDNIEPSFEIGTSVGGNALHLPSYQKFTDNREDIVVTESKLLSLQQKKTVLQNEFDRIPSSRAKSMKQKLRKEELEQELTEISSEIGKLKKKLRELDIISTI